MRKNKNKNLSENIITVSRRIDWPISTWLVIGLLVLNAILAWPMLRDGFSRYIESIEGAHLVNAAWILHKGGSWNDLWYFGFPAHLTYPPLLPNLIAWVSGLFSITITHAYRLSIGGLIWLIPLGIYLFAVELTKRKTIGALAALMFMIMPNIAYFLIPEVQTVPTSVGWVPYHWVVFAQYGEGPHVAAIFFMMISATFFLRTLDSRSRVNIAGSALFLALTMLTNLFAGFALILILIILQIARMFVYVFDVPWRRLLLIGIIGYGMTAFAFDLTFIKSILASSYIHPENAMHWPPFMVIFFILIFIIIPLTLLGYHMVMGKDKYYPLLAMTMWAGLFLLVAAVYYYFGYNLVTQPNRYLHEAQIGTVILIAMGMTFLIDNARQTIHEEERATKYILVGLGILVFIFAPSYSYLKNPGWIIKPQTMDYSYEKEIADRLNEIVDTDRGERAYLTGTPSFWLNVFSPVPQIRGGADNAQPNPWWADAAYQINKSDNENLTKAWLNLLNVKYILVNYPESGTHYVDYENFDRFANWSVADEFAEGGFKLYQVPDSNLSLFSVIKVADIAPLLDFSKNDSQSVIDLANLFNQADNQRVKYEKINAGHYRLTIDDLQANEVIVFKMNSDERWRAMGPDDNYQIETVGPNFMMIRPGVTGEAVIDWQVGTTKSEIAGQLLTLITLLLTVNWLIREKK